jgi:phenylpyruvate tautomerase PptA (4-oxalocrotonate tautomerase family)
MPFLEVFTLEGSVSDEQRARISERLVPEVMAGEGAPDTEGVRSISWLVWNEVKHWSIGGESLSREEPPRYVVRVSMPAASLTDEKRAEVVKRVTQVLAETDEHPERFFAAPPASFVLINEVPEGNWGSAGMIFRFEDIVSYALKGAPGQMDQTEVRDAFGLSEEPAPAL